MLIASMLLLAVQTAPGFDCDRAALPAEQAICANPELAIRDRALALLYDRGAAQFPAVRAAQHRWLTDERNACRSDTCLRQAYDLRIQALADVSTFAEPLRHQDYVASLMLAPLGGDWYLFRAGTASERATAAAAGVIHMPGGSGRWRHGADCTLEMRSAGARWQVQQDASCAHAFSGLSLDGTYMTEKDWWYGPSLDEQAPAAG